EKPFGDQANAAQIIHALAPMVRAAIVDQRRDPRTELESLDLDDWPGLQAAGIGLRILGYASNSVLAIDFHRRIASLSVERWDQESENRSSRGQRDYQSTDEFLQRVARFVLSLDDEQALLVCAPFG